MTGRKPKPAHVRPNRSIRFLPGRIEVRMTIRKPSVAAIVAAFRDAQRSAVEMQIHNDGLEVRQLVREKRATIGSAPGRDYPTIKAWLKSVRGPRTKVEEVVRIQKLPPRLRRRGRKPRAAV